MPDSFPGPRNHPGRSLPHHPLRDSLGSITDTPPESGVTPRPITRNKRRKV
jgi:hypothetical protein